MNPDDILPPDETGRPQRNGINGVFPILTACPHRTEWTKQKVMTCVLIPGVQMPLPGRQYCPCGSCEAQWTNGPPTPETLTAAILERLPRIPKAVDEFTGRPVNPRGDCGGCR